MLVFFALGNAKVLSFGLGDAKVPNANGFASQWNIGFRLRWFGADLVRMQYLCHFSGDLRIDNR